MMNQQQQQTPALNALFRSTKKKSQPNDISNLPPEWHYNESKSTWESCNDSHVKLGPISMLSLSPIEQELLRCLAIYRLQHFGCEISKYVIQASRKRTIDYRVDLDQIDDQDPSVLPLIDLGPNAQRKQSHQPINKALSDSEKSNINEGGLTKRNSTRRKSSHLMDVLAPVQKDSNDSVFVRKLSNARQSKTEIKHLVQRCCSFVNRKGLSTEGIFRIPATKKRIKELKESIRKNGFDLASQDASVHDVAGLLKEILREMPEPLLSTELYDAFMATTKLFHREQIRAIQLMLCMIPCEEKEILFELLAFLNRIHNCSSPTIDKFSGTFLTGNKMDAKNLAIVFSPNLIRRTRSSQGSSSRSQSLAEVDTATEVVQLMIEHYETLLKISTRMHNEIVKLLSTLRKELLVPVICYKINRGIGLTMCRLSNSDKTKMDQVDLSRILDQSDHSTLFDLNTDSVLSCSDQHDDYRRPWPSIFRLNHPQPATETASINRNMRKPSQPNRIRRQYTNFISHFSIASLSRCVMNLMSSSSSNNNNSISRRRRDKGGNKATTTTAVNTKRSNSAPYTSQNVERRGDSYIGEQFSSSSSYFE